MANDDVIFETSNVRVHKNGYCNWKTDMCGTITDELAHELARLYLLLESKEDDGK